MADTETKSQRWLLLPSLSFSSFLLFSSFVLFSSFTESFFSSFWDRSRYEYLAGLQLVNPPASDFQVPPLLVFGALLDNTVKMSHLLEFDFQ